MPLGTPDELQISLGRMLPSSSRLGQPAEHPERGRHMARNADLNGELIRLDGTIRMGVK